MILPEQIAYWPPEWFHRFQEREAIMIESNVSDAAEKAEADVRRQAEGIGQGSIFDDVTPLRKLGGAA